jgi:hypothetical protein
MSDQSTCNVNNTQELYPALAGRNPNGNIKRVPIDNRVVIGAQGNQLTAMYYGISEVNKIIIDDPVVLVRPLVNWVRDNGPCTNRTTFIQRNVFVSLVGGKQRQLQLGTILFAKDGKVNILEGALADAVLKDADGTLLDKAKEIIAGLQPANIKTKRVSAKYTFADVETADRIVLNPGNQKNQRCDESCLM